MQSIGNLADAAKRAVSNALSSPPGIEVLGIEEIVEPQRKKQRKEVTVSPTWVHEMNRCNRVAASWEKALTPPVSAIQHAADVLANANLPPDDGRAYLLSPAEVDEVTQAAETFNAGMKLMRERIARNAKSLAPELAGLARQNKALVAQTEAASEAAIEAKQAATEAESKLQATKVRSSPCSSCPLPLLLPQPSVLLLPLLLYGHPARVTPSNSRDVAASGRPPQFGRRPLGHRLRLPALPRDRREGQGLQLLRRAHRLYSRAGCAPLRDHGGRLLRVRRSLNCETAFRCSLPTAAPLLTTAPLLTAAPSLAPLPGGWRGDARAAPLRLGHRRILLRAAAGASHSLPPQACILPLRASYFLPHVMTWQATMMEALGVDRT